MKAGLGLMGLPPHVFWAMSLPEWVAAQEGFVERFGGGGASTPLSRHELFDLMQRYPD